MTKASFPTRETVQLEMLDLFIDSQTLVKTFFFSIPACSYFFRNSSIGVDISKPEGKDIHKKFMRRVSHREF